MNASRAALLAVAGLGATAALALPRHAAARRALQPALQPEWRPVRVPVHERDRSTAIASPPHAGARAEGAPTPLAPLPDPDPDRPTRRVRPEREALKTLALVLQEPIFDRERWERAASALAADLDRRDVARLAAASLAAASGEVGIDRVLAAAALLTHARYDARDAPLPPTALAALRTAWSGAVGSERSSAAVRSLLALGDVSDRRGILAELHAPDADRRSRASWGLQGSGGVQLVSDLANEFGALRIEHDDQAALQALTALRSVVAHTDDWTLDLARSVELQLRDVLLAEEASSVMHLRATAVLASLPVSQVGYSTFKSGVK